MYINLSHLSLVSCWSLFSFMDSFAFVTCHSLLTHTFASWYTIFITLLGFTIIIVLVIHATHLFVPARRFCYSFSNNIISASLLHHPHSAIVDNLIRIETECIYCLLFGQIPSYTLLLLHLSLSCCASLLSILTALIRPQRPFQRRHPEASYIH